MLVYFVRPEANPQDVHPALRDLVLPVETYTIWHADGGSATVGFRDSNGKQVTFMLPHPMSDPSYYGKLYLGYYEDGEEIDEQRYPDTRLAIFRILERYENRYPSDADVLSKLNPTLIDEIRLRFKWFTGYYSRDKTAEL